MILLRREAVPSVLRRYRTTTVQELRTIFLLTVGIDVFRNRGEAILDFHDLGADWFFNSSILLDGYCTLGVLPAMAEDLDPGAPALTGDYASCPREIPASEELVFSRFVQRHQALAGGKVRPAFAHASAILRREDRQCWHAYPHQLLSKGAARLDGDWRICRARALGPFAYETSTDRARITMEVFGPAEFLFLVPAGYVDVIVNADRARFEVPDDHRGVIVTCPVGSPSDRCSYALRRVELVWNKPGDPQLADVRWKWYGLFCQEMQPWFCEDIPIDADFLRTYLPLA
jgi:hypothetical protein